MVKLLLLCDKIDINSQDRVNLLLIQQIINLETIKFIVNKAGITPDSVLHFANNPNFFLIFPKQKK